MLMQPVSATVETDPTESPIVAGARGVEQLEQVCSAISGALVDEPGGEGPAPGFDAALCGATSALCFQPITCDDDAVLLALVAKRQASRLEHRLPEGVDGDLSTAVTYAIDALADYLAVRYGRHLPANFDGAIGADLRDRISAYDKRANARRERAA